jgi:ribose transport system permease protein
MRRLLGVLFMVTLLYVALMALSANARSWSNQQDIAGRLGFYGVLTVGVGVLIISGGIDLSIGSVVGLAAVSFSLLMEQKVAPWPAVGVVLLGTILIGLAHGLLVTRLRLQPFLVTLCGLFIYRGLARWASPTNVGLKPTWFKENFEPGEEALRLAQESFRQQLEGMRWLLFGGDPLGVPNQFVLLVVLTVLLGLLMHGTIHGRYLYAIGHNEVAARYAGIATDRYKILAYVLCSTLAGLGGVLFLLDNENATPTSAGSLLELYAITGAVLGGCILRGGEGTVPGMFLGAAVLPLLRQLCNFGGIRNELEYAVIGLALLLGTIVDELLKQRETRRG